MEVFPMPQSNKKTAILPNLHHTGLQSCCSLLLALRPSGCARPQSHAVPMHGGIRTSWAMPDPLITGIPAPPSCAGLQPWIRPTPCWNTRPLDMPPDPWEQGSPLPGHSGPRLELVPQLVRIPAPWNHLPSGPAQPQLWMGWPQPHTSDSLPIRTSCVPALCGTTGALLHWDRHQPGMRQLHPPAHQEPCS
jgi:hypothetical protein